MAKRLRHWIVQLLICIDQLAAVWIAGWLYVWIGNRPCPNADETISSHVGRAAEAGKRWALICEPLINAIFGAGHCRREIEQLKPLGF